jgi:hypothetical protein
LAHRNSGGDWLSIFTNRILPKKLSFLPPVQTILPTLPDVQPGSVIVPAVGLVPDEPGTN